MLEVKLKLFFLPLLGLFDVIKKTFYHTSDKITPEKNMK